MIQEVLLEGQFVWENDSIYAFIGDERDQGGIFPQTILWDEPERSGFEDFIRDKIGTRNGRLIFIPEPG